MDLDWSRWQAFHLFYHADRNLLLLRLIRPLVGSLARAGAIDRFFFVRYELGGPHVRLRLRSTPGAMDVVEERVREASADYFARWPSVQPRTDELVLQRLGKFWRRTRANRTRQSTLITISKLFPIAQKLTATEEPT